MDGRHWKVAAALFSFLYVTGYGAQILTYEFFFKSSFCNECKINWKGSMRLKSCNVLHIIGINKISSGKSL